MPGLPPGYTARRPTLGDDEGLLAVVHAAERDAFGRDDSTLGDVRELLRLRRTPLETDQQLVETDDRTAAARGMVIDDYGGEQVDLDVYADPAHPEEVSHQHPQGSRCKSLLRRLTRTGRIGTPPSSTRSPSIGDSRP